MDTVGLRIDSRTEAGVSDLSAGVDIPAARENSIEGERRESSTKNVNKAFRRNENDDNCKRQESSD